MKLKKQRAKIILILISMLSVISVTINIFASDTFNPSTGMYTYYDGSNEYSPINLGYIDSNKADTRFYNRAAMLPNRYYTFNGTVNNNYTISAKSSSNHYLNLRVNSGSGFFKSVYGYNPSINFDYSGTVTIFIDDADMSGCNVTLSITSKPIPTTTTTTKPNITTTTAKPNITTTTTTPTITTTTTTPNITTTTTTPTITTTTTTTTTIPHTHSYITTIKKATPTDDGKIVKKCACGTTASTVIKKVSTVKLSTTKYTYDGKVKAPTLTVKDSAGKALVKGTDYTVTTPSGRKNVGKYTYKITFKGNYSGTKSLSFVINPKNTSISKLTATKGGLKATIKKYTTQTTGYQIRYSTKSNMSGAKTVTIAKNTTTSKSVTGLTKGKKYYVQIRTFKTVNGRKYYSAWSGNKTVTTKK